MRIGIIGDALDIQYAGVHYYVKNLILELEALESDHKFIVFTQQPTDIKSDNLEYVHIPLVSWIPFYNVVRIFLIFPIIARLKKLDVLIEPAHFGPFFMPKSIKKVTVIHDLTPLLFPQWHTWKGRVLQKLFLPRIIKNADMIIANSNYTKQDIINEIGISKDKIVAAHLGIDKIFRHTKDTSVLSKYEIDRPYILYLGTIEPRKNLERLIEAYELFCAGNKNNNTILVLAGKLGWQTEGILNKIKESKYKESIKLIGYVAREEMPALYSHAQMFIYPSVYEGFGLPIAEAMACGVPVLCSNSSSMPEVGGDHAYYFDPEDVHSISSQIERVKNLEEYDAQSAVKHAQSFSWTKMTHEIVKELELRFQSTEL